VIRGLEPKDAEACDAILAGLPDWFGNPVGIKECAEAVRSQPGYVATDGAGAVAGFLTWVRTPPDSAEITWMAVRSDSRRRGLGLALIDELVGRLRADGVRSLLVKTLSDRSPDEHYAQTRAFYRSVGFDPIAELDVWGPENPAQLLRRML
jgi:ribosomal protein S18 acetylase RimI-like enzyme